MSGVASDIGQPQNKTRVDHFSGANSDIIKTIHRNFNDAVNETKGVADRFRGGSNLETANNIWEFLRNEIKYQVDPQGVQQIRLPRRFLSDKTGDCKSFSLFTAGVLRNLGLPVTFRYTSYSSSPTPGHVYVVTKDENGHPIIIDGVWMRFDDEKEYKHKTDYTMRIETLSGIDGIAGKKPKRPKKKLKDILKGLAGKVKATFPPLILGRNAFLGLVRINVRGFATRLSHSIKQNPALVQKVWNDKVGGNYSALLNAVNAGKGKKPIFPQRVGEILGIGLAPAAIAALVAAAPIVLTVVQFILKPTGQANDPAIEEAVEDANAGLETEISEDDIDDANKNGTGKPPKGGSFGFAGFDPCDPLCWINALLKATIISTGTSLLF